MHKPVERYCKRVSHQRLIITDYRLELKYTKGENNETTDALS